MTQPTAVTWSDRPDGILGRVEWQEWQDSMKELQRLRAWADRHARAVRQLRELEEERPELIQKAFEETGNVKRIAEELGVSRVTVYSDLRRRIPGPLRRHG